MNIKDLIKEGEELRGTFTKDLNLTIDRQGISEWITKCLLVLERQFTVNSVFYEVFAERLNKIGNLRLTEFDDLIGTLKGINKEYKEEDSVFF